MRLSLTVVLLNVNSQTTSQTAVSLVCQKDRAHKTAVAERLVESSLWLNMNRRNSEEAPVVPSCPSLLVPCRFSLLVSGTHSYRKTRLS